MKYYKLFLLFIFIIQPLFAKGQDSTHISPSPFTFSASYLGDNVWNLNGGIDQNHGYLGYANFKMLFNTEDAKLWKGGSFLINGANTHGATPTESFIGDFQGASNIEAGDLTYLHELWYEQNFNRFTAVIGLQDLNAEFITSNNASLYINSSFGNPSTIAENIHAPIFPLTAFGLQLHYSFNDKNALKIAIFDGFPDESDLNPYNLKWRLGQKDGYITFTEFSTKLSLFKEKSGEFRFGMYTHNHLTDTTKFIRKYGFYAIGDQYLYTTNNGHSISIFAQASYGPSKENLNNCYFSGGVNITNILLKKIDSTLGLAFNYAGLKSPEVQHEAAIELTYKMDFTENIFVQPDLQYIINPSGTGVALPNATVAIIRFGLNF